MSNAPSTASRSSSPVVFATGEEDKLERTSPACGEGGTQGQRRDARDRAARAALAAAVSLAPSMALAHEGHHEQMGVAEAARHLATQPDHQMMFAALVVLAVAGGWAWARKRTAK